MTTTSKPASPPQPAGLRRAFAAAAVGRILLGATAFAYPASQTRMNGVPDHMLSTELKYLIRIFGARAWPWASVISAATNPTGGAGNTSA